MNLNPTSENDLERPEPRPRFGLTIARDIVISPNRAFDKIIASRGWLATYLLIVLTTFAVTALYAPALIHVASVTPPPPGESAPATPAAIALASQQTIANLALAQLLMPLAMLLLTASALTTVARFKGSVQPYALFFSLATNCIVPSIIGSLVTALVVRAHDPASFPNLRALEIALPTNLAVFSTPGNDRELAFLSRFDIFDIWSYVLLAFGFVRLVPVKFTTALIVAFGLDFLFAMIF